MEAAEKACWDLANKGKMWVWNLRNDFFCQVLFASFLHWQASMQYDRKDSKYSTVWQLSAHALFIVHIKKEKPLIMHVGMNIIIKGHCNAKFHLCIPRKGMAWPHSQFPHSFLHRKKRFCDFPFPQPGCHLSNSF